MTAFSTGSAQPGALLPANTFAVAMCRRLGNGSGRAVTTGDRISTTVNGNEGGIGMTDAPRINYDRLAPKKPLKGKRKAKTQQSHKAKVRKALRGGKAG